MGLSAKVCLGGAGTQGTGWDPAKGPGNWGPQGQVLPTPAHHSLDTWPAAPGHSNRPSPRTTWITDPSTQTPGPPPQHPWSELGVWHQEGPRLARGTAGRLGKANSMVCGGTGNRVTGQMAGPKGALAPRQPRSQAKHTVRRLSRDHQG